MGVKYVKVEGRKAECPCSVTTEKGVLWDFPGDNYRHFQTLCGPCADEMFGDINMFKLPILTQDQITERRPDKVSEGESEPECTVDASQCSEAVLDMLANLACRVTELEKLAGMQRNENRLAHVRIEEINDKTEMCIRDIAMLDERTYELVEPKQAAEALLRKIAKLIEEEGGGI